jgi:hypothetical protein
MGFAHELAKRCLPAYSCKYSRHDFTLPQLFACLVLREQMNLGYRGTEALLCDSRSWCREIGMKKVPDHNTLCRAFAVIVKAGTCERLLDLLAIWMAKLKLLGPTCAIDSTLCDTHHRSRHYEQRCRHYASHGGKTGDLRRSRTARRAPKLTVAVDTRSHLILAARARTGMGADAPDFLPVLRAGRRRNRRLRTALADAGFDSHANHQVARRRLHVHTLIKAGSGRPSTRPPRSRHRREMQRRLAGSQKGRPYGQRSQVETAHSMMKRNLGDNLCARTPACREREQLLRVITHNVMIL